MTITTALQLLASLTFIPVTHGISFATLPVTRELGQWTPGGADSLAVVRARNGRLALYWLHSHPTDTRRYRWDRPDFSIAVYGYDGEALAADCAGQWLTREECARAILAIETRNDWHSCQFCNSAPAGDSFNNKPICEECVESLDTAFVNPW